MPSSLFVAVIISAAPLASLPALPMATPIPAAASMLASFWPSPKAMTLEISIPRWGSAFLSALALSIPGAVNSK